MDSSCRLVRSLTVEEKSWLLSRLSPRSWQNQRERSNEKENLRHNVLHDVKTLSHIGSLPLRHSGSDVFLPYERLRGSLLVFRNMVNTGIPVGVKLLS